MSPGLAVAISTRSASLSTPPRDSWFQVAAIFSSPSTLRVPDGVQSDPRQTRSPAALAAITSVVPPYSQRLENGDQTIAPPPRASHSRKSSAASAVEWMPTSPLPTH